MEEIWKDIPGYEGYYQASNLGNIRSLDRIVKHNYGGDSIKNGKIKTATISKAGYRLIGLWKNNKLKTVKVCRKVWESFNGPIPDGMQINHIDECKTNDAIWNLNLMTPKENSNWGTRTQRSIDNRKGKTARRRIIQYDTDGNFIHEWCSLIEIEKTTSLSYRNIQKCCAKKTKTAYGYVWRYAS